MSSEELERYRLELEHREKREARRADLFKWFVAFAWPSILTFLNAVYQHQAAVEVANKVDVAAADVKAVATSQATAVKAELTTANKQQDEKLGALVVGMDANVKSWRAYDTKKSDDMDVAAKAVEHANEALPAVLPPKP